MAGWATIDDLYREELKQRREEGCDVDAFLQTHPGVPEDLDTLNRWYDELMTLPVDPSFPYDEPTSYADILAARPAAQPSLPETDIPFDSFYGAWLGRCIGCALGKPTECLMGGKSDKASWELVYAWFRDAGAYPIRGYTPAQSPAAERLGIGIGCPQSMRENIAFMESDDDIRYTVLGLKITEEIGKHFTTRNVIRAWIDELPFAEVCTAEQQAYINWPFAREMMDMGASEAEALQYTRTHRNPYREWIGAQIRVDGFAYSAAGDPELAADFAYRDASLSHVKNGIYGEMFFGAAIAAAFVEKDIHKIIEIGLSKIPARSRLAEDIRAAVAVGESAADEFDLIRKVYARWGHYNPVHTNNNAALCVATLVFAGDDFTKAVATAVLGGWDTDCNGATVGSLMGAKLGAENIPGFWKEPLHDTLYSRIFGYHPIPISKCAEKSMAVWKRFKAEA